MVIHESFVPNAKDNICAAATKKEGEILNAMSTEIILEIIERVPSL